MPVTTVVSLLPVEMNEEKPGLFPGRFIVPACVGDVPGICVIPDSKYFYYVDESRGSIPIEVPSAKIASSLVQDFCSAQLGTTADAGPGVFCIPGTVDQNTLFVKHFETMSHHVNRQKNWFRNLCRMADDDFSKNRLHAVVSDFQRRAAITLGLNPAEHPWMSPREEEKKANVKCKSCRSTIDIEAVVCPVCRAILDAKKHKELQFAE